MSCTLTQVTEEIIKPFSNRTSRCSLLTGKHTGHAYIRGNKGIKSEEGFFDLHLPSDEVTVAEILKRKGYATMCVGKWGLGGPHTTGSPVRT